MTLYKLCEWEYSQRDESDWYAVVYNDEIDQLERIETGTTRFAEALYTGPVTEPPTDEILIKARKALARMFFNILKLSEQNTVLTPRPDNINKGMQVRFLENHRCMIKEKTTSSCVKCGGTGKWTNPRNDADQRECFACRGKGEVVISYSKKKDSEGKQEWTDVEKETVGTVVFSKSYGAFYRGGYNQPNRSNTTVTLKLEDGREVRAPLKKLRLRREIDSDEVIQEKADKLAAGDNFYIPFATAKHF